ncbi:MAG: response regulator transcription factor [Anaerolineaceae bacterium]|nr:response regulator transcription factor [Anaerolineaceae bacterium]
MDERVLVIEDDEEISRLLQRALIFEGYRVDVAADGTTGLVVALEHKPALIILDIMLPGIDGLEVCRRIRKLGDTPIIMVTAKEDVKDRVSGLDAGADDYMVKPFEIEELLARVRALLRRTVEDRPEVLTFADLTLDSNTRLATRGGRVITLTNKEFNLLDLFMRHPGQVMTREMIFDRVWDYDFGGESNVLDVYIRYLRQKLGEGGEPQLIYTVRSVGYVMRNQD